MKKKIKTFITGCFVTFFITPIAWAGVENKKETFVAANLSQHDLSAYDDHSRPDVPKERPFKLRIKTDNKGFSGLYSFVIPTNTGDYDYNYNVDCDSDGVNEATGVNGDYTCQYNLIGEYTISISGNFPSLYFHVPSNESSLVEPKKIISIEQWGDIKWLSMNYAFKNAENMIGNAKDIPDLTRVKDVSGMFLGAAMFNQNINNWDMSNVTNMRGMFYFAITFNQPLDQWDVSKVTYMNSVFYVAKAFNQPLNTWNVSNVEDMRGMFWFAVRFDQPLNNWNVSNVGNMSGMFYAAKSFNQEINAWDVSSVTKMSSMFACTNSFNQSLNNWDVSNVTDMRRMFSVARGFNQPLNNWDVSNVTNMHRMFSIASNFNQSLYDWGVRVQNVTDMSFMFNRAESFSNHDLTGWQVANVVDHENFFTDAGDGNIEPIWANSPRPAVLRE